MKSRTEAIAEAIIDIVLDNVMWKKESPYSKLKEYVNNLIVTMYEEQLNTGNVTSSEQMNNTIKLISEKCQELFSEDVIWLIDKLIRDKIKMVGYNINLQEIYYCVIYSLKYYVKGMQVDMIPTISQEGSRIVRRMTSIRDNNVRESGINDIYIVHLHSLVWERIRCEVISHIAAYLTHIIEMIENRCILAMERSVKPKTCKTCKFSFNVSNFLTTFIYLGLVVSSIVFLWRGRSIFEKEQFFVLSIIIVVSFCITYIFNTIVKMLSNRHVDDND